MFLDGDYPSAARFRWRCQDGCRGPGQLFMQLRAAASPQTGSVFRARRWAL